MLDAPRAIEEMKLPENIQHINPALTFLRQKSIPAIKEMAELFKAKLGINR